MNSPLPRKCPITDTVEIRALKTEEWSIYKDSRLRALRLAPTAYASDYETQKDFPDEFFQQRVTFLPHNFIYGAWLEEQLIGTAGGFVEQDRKRRHIAHVVGVWVEPEHRQQGIARKLTEAALTQLKQHPDVTSVQIAATATNETAVKLYESMGFVRYGVEPDALQHDDQHYDEVLMAMAITR